MLKAGQRFLTAQSKNIYIALLFVLALGLILVNFPVMAPFFSWITPPVALFTGLIYALLCGQGFPLFNRKLSSKLLQLSVVGLGFGMNIQAALASGKDGMIFTIVSVVGTMLIGGFIGRKILKVDSDTSYLISSGTAICGGSAIAAVGPVLGAKGGSMSVALGTIFILNAIALFIFPPIGHYLGLTQHEFGLWAAIAIHDTSSVVGAGSAYGPEALEMATTVKLTRALWIIPLAIFTGYWVRRRAIKSGVSDAAQLKAKKIKIPWFIFLFILAMLINTYLLSHSTMGFDIGQALSKVAKGCLTLSLFFIGASLSRDVLKQVGIKPLIQGFSLWILISVVTLLYIKFWSF